MEQLVIAATTVLLTWSIAYILSVLRPEECLREDPKIGVFGPVNRS